MRTAGFFITATDTGVGKTVIAGALAAYLCSIGKDVGVMKPAETSCHERGGELYPSDAFFLKRISGSNDPLDLICPYRFAEPLAPAVAAKRAGKKIDTTVIGQKFREISVNHEVVIVEGAGGLMVPLSGRYTYLDLAKELGLPVIIVARAGLGTINHTLLTVAAAKNAGLEVAGIILNNGGKESGAAVETNPGVIRSIAGGVPVLSVGYYTRIKRDRSKLAEVGNEIFKRFLT